VASVLAEVLGERQAHYEAAPEDADALLAVGLAPKPADLDPREVASYAAVARVILNLHETITRY
jgi:hypothetical protein